MHSALHTTLYIYVHVYLYLVQCVLTYGENAPLCLRRSTNETAITPSTLRMRLGFYMRSSGNKRAWECPKSYSELQKEFIQLNLYGSLSVLILLSTHPHTHTPTHPHPHLHPHPHTHTPTHPHTNWLGHLLTHSLAYSLTHSLAQFTHSHNDCLSMLSFIRSLTQFFFLTHVLIQALLTRNTHQQLTHPHTHSFILPIIHTQALLLSHIHLQEFKIFSLTCSHKNSK